MNVLNLIVLSDVPKAHKSIACALVVPLYIELADWLRVCFKSTVAYELELRSVTSYTTVNLGRNCQKFKF